MRLQAAGDGRSCLTDSAHVPDSGLLPSSDSQGPYCCQRYDSSLYHYWSVPLSSVFTLNSTLRNLPKKKPIPGTFCDEIKEADWGPAMETMLTPVYPKSFLFARSQTHPKWTETSSLQCVLYSYLCPLAFTRSLKPITGCRE
jgi:hypothetical protein